MSDRPISGAALARPTWHRFLSPHYDDISLSCGGTAALLARAGRAPEVAIVFGDEPDPRAPLTPFAEQMHQGWGLDAAGVIAARRREEQAAAAVLGTTVRILPFHDAIYRGAHYTSDAELFAEPAAAEAALPKSVASAVMARMPPDPRGRLYAPLAVGGHVDHRHVFAVAVSLARAGWEVWFYEDLPYALKAGAVEERVAAAGVPLAPAAVVDVAPVWEAKLAAILAYPSQLATAFGYVGVGSSPAEIGGALRAYARERGGDTLGERFWAIGGGGR